MDNIKEFKKKAINDYMSQIIDYNNIDIDQIKEDIQKLIGEKPGVQLNYKQEQLITEDGSKPKRTEKLESINVIFSYETEIAGRILPMAETIPFIIG